MSGGINQVGESPLTSLMYILLGIIRYRNFIYTPTHTHIHAGMNGERIYFRKEHKPNCCKSFVIKKYSDYRKFSKYIRA